MSPGDIIMKKRLGQTLSREEIRAFVRGATDGSFADYQLSAMLMAICIQGMSPEETVELTMAMAESGERMDLSAIRGVKVDKHSTGGVGDTTTLILAPLIACCPGIKMAKMSGRGLGHTGGTLDKLEAIPGMNVGLSRQRFMEIADRIGVALTGQSAELAPADQKLYALRDVTATVDSLPLITSSILSKKIAAGCDVVVLDVKSGSGALMPTLEKSIELAQTMVQIGNRTGRRFSALVTDMDQPLGLYVGNALEVKEAILTLSGAVQGPLKQVSLMLGGQILKSAGLVQDTKQGADILESKIKSGEGLKKMAQWIQAQGGDERVVEEPDRLPKAGREIDLLSAQSGYVSALNTAMIGNAARVLGAGRLKKEDTIDPAVGLVMKKRIGDFVKAGECWCTLHVGADSDLNQARSLMDQALSLSPIRQPAPRLIHAVVDAQGTHYIEG